MTTETLPDGVCCVSIHVQHSRYRTCLSTHTAEGANIELGAFSISLAVKDMEASRAFYEKFGFKVFAGDASQHWTVRLVVGGLPLVSKAS
jgi:catechol-2,3-dioxygenase